MTDPYRILGVSKDSSDAEIKKTYRNLAKKLHPDTNQGDQKVAERFKEISAAYSLIGDKKKRAQYDNGEINADGAPTGFAGGGSPFGGGGNFSRGHSGGGGARSSNPFGGGAGFNPEDILSSMFGGGGQSTRARAAGTGGGSMMRGKDKIYKVQIDLMDAVKGLKKKITLDNDKTFNVTIPKGVTNEQQIRLKGQGSAGRFGGSSGDALIEIYINPHEFFKLDGNDIHLDLPITLKEAVLGAKVNVPTLTGKIALTIPKNTSSGKVVRLKDKGMQSTKLNDPAGHLYIKFMIMIPEETDKTLKKLVKNIGDDWENAFATKIRNAF